MPFSYDRYDSTRRTPSLGPRRRTTLFGYWVPLFVTATLAVGGLAAWVWAAREDHESSTSASGGSNSDSDDEHLSYGTETDREAAAAARESRRRRRREGVEGVEQTATERGVVLAGEGGGAPPGEDAAGDGSIIGRVAAQMRRTPSPQVVWDGAARTVAAGWGAAAQAVGGALGAIREEGGEERDDFGDHERWREEEGRRERGVPGAGKKAFGGKRRTVAIVVSAEEGGEEEDLGKYKNEHASLLSHIPPPDLTKINLLILIYSPRRTTQPAQTTAHGGRPTSSLSSSYSAIATPAATTPGEELTSMDPMPTTPALSARSSGSSYAAFLHKQALRLVEADAAVMPFATAAGYVPMLKHLAPDVVYVTDSLAGEDGDSVAAVKGWVGQVVVVVGGDAAGLVDETEDEGEGEDAGKRWWEGNEMVGLGKGVEIVDGVRVEEDFERRVMGRD